MTTDDFLVFPDDAVAIVTGAGAGIGRAITVTLLAAGVRVAGWDMVPRGIEELADEHPENFLSATLDVNDISQIVEALERVNQRFGPARFLVNNAGPASDTPFGFVEGIAASLGSMEKVTSAWLATESSTDGNVVNIASVAGNWIGVSGAQNWYPAAKAGVAGWTRQLALSRPSGIRANAVAPGMTRTARTAAGMESPDGRAIIARNPSVRPAEPEDIAAAAVFLLAPVSRYINGVILPVDGGSLLTQ